MILRYLKGTRSYDIMFERQQGDSCINGFVDLNYGGDLNKQRSTIGCVFTYGGSAFSLMVEVQDLGDLHCNKSVLCQQQKLGT